jgi:hypothetical protein
MPLFNAPQSRNTCGAQIKSALPSKGLHNGEAAYISYRRYGVTAAPLVMDQGRADSLQSIRSQVF